VGNIVQVYVICVREGCTLLSSVVNFVQLRCITLINHKTFSHAMWYMRVEEPDFRRVSQNCKNETLLASVYLSVRQHGTTRLPLADFHKI
jgi:hypothetical protein